MISNNENNIKTISKFIPNFDADRFINMIDNSKHSCLKINTYDDYLKSFDFVLNDLKTTLKQEEITSINKYRKYINAAVFNIFKELTEEEVSDVDEDDDIVDDDDNNDDVESFDSETFYLDNEAEEASFSDIIEEDAEESDDGGSFEEEDEIENDDDSASSNSSTLPPPPPPQSTLPPPPPTSRKSMSKYKESMQKHRRNI